MVTNKNPTRMESKYKTKETYTLMICEMEMSSDRVASKHNNIVYAIRQQEEKKHYMYLDEKIKYQNQELEVK